MQLHECVQRDLDDSQQRGISDGEKLLQQPVAQSQQLFGIGNATWIGTPRVVSWQPLATVYDSFLSDEECEYLLNISRPLMEPAMLVNNKRQQHVRSESRTSQGAFHDSVGDPVLAMITHRIAHVARVPPGAPLSAAGVSFNAVFPCNACVVRAGYVAHTPCKPLRCVHPLCLRGLGAVPLPPLY